MYNKQMKALFVLLGAMLLTGCAGKMVADSIETVSETSAVETSVEETEATAETEAEIETATETAVETETAAETETAEETKETQETETAEKELKENTLSQAIMGKIPVHAVDSESGEEYTFLITDLPKDKDDPLSCYSIGERVDLDNDGEDELVIDGPYGGMYIDARDGEAYLLAEGEGTAAVLTYATYGKTTYICHVDNSHGGREVYLMDAYDGNGNIVESTRLSAEFEELGYFDDTATCYIGEEMISATEFEMIRASIFGF